VETSNRVVRSEQKRRSFDDDFYVEKKRGHWTSRKSIKSKRFMAEHEDYH
jgi:hypothetical protein